MQTFDLHDRLELINRLHSYGHHIDEREMDSLLSLFTPDATVLFVYDNGKTTDTYVGRDRIARLYQAGMDEPDPVRHLMTNVVFLEQTATLAKSVSYGAISRKRDGKFTFSNTLTYRGTWRKDDGQWMAEHWVITAD